MEKEKDLRKEIKAYHIKKFALISEITYEPKIPDTVNSQNIMMCGKIDDDWFELKVFDKEAGFFGPFMTNSIKKIENKEVLERLNNLGEK